MVTPFTSLIVLDEKTKSEIEKEIESETAAPPVVEPLAGIIDESEDEYALIESEHYLEYESGISHLIESADYSHTDSIEYLEPPRPRPSSRLHDGGRGGSSGGGFSGDPHCLIPFNEHFHLCFNWDGEENQV